VLAAVLTHLGAGAGGASSGDGAGSGGDTVQQLRPPAGDRTSPDCVRTRGGAVVLGGAARVVPTAPCSCNPQAHSSPVSVTESEGPLSPEECAPVSRVHDQKSHDALNVPQERLKSLHLTSLQCATKHKLSSTIIPETRATLISASRHVTDLHTASCCGHGP
jgi:hypothetical protein